MGDQQRPEVVPLCYRCEYRARFLETGRGFRYECKQADKAVVGCYMYQPVQPLLLRADEGDERPFLGPPIVSARHHAVGLAPVELVGKEADEGGVVLYWEPK